MSEDSDNRLQPIKNYTEFRIVNLRWTGKVNIRKYTQCYGSAYQTSSKLLATMQTCSQAKSASILISLSYMYLHILLVRQINSPPENLALLFRTPRKLLKKPSEYSWKWDLNMHPKEFRKLPQWFNGCFEHTIS